MVAGGTARCRCQEPEEDGNSQQTETSINFLFCDSIAARAGVEPAANRKGRKGPHMIYHVMTRAEFIWCDNGKFRTHWRKENELNPSPFPQRRQGACPTHNRTSASQAPIGLGSAGQVPESTNSTVGEEIGYIGKGVSLVQSDTKWGCSGIICTLS